MLLEQYCESVPQDLRDLDDALARDDAASAARAAHRMRGAALFMGAQEIASLATQLEAVIAYPGIRAAHGLLTALRAAHARLKDHCCGP